MFAAIAVSSLRLKAFVSRKLNNFTTISLLVGSLTLCFLLLCTYLRAIKNDHQCNIFSYTAKVFTYLPTSKSDLEA